MFAKSQFIEQLPVYFWSFLPHFTHRLVALSQQKTHFCLVTKVRFLNDVCLWQMMLASPMMFALRMMRGFATFYGKHRIIAKRSGATSYLRSKCIISPQGDVSFEDIQGYALIYLWKCDIINLPKIRNLMADVRLGIALAVSRGVLATAINVRLLRLR